MRSGIAARTTSFCHAELPGMTEEGRLPEEFPRLAIALFQDGVPAPEIVVGVAEKTRTEVDEDRVALPEIDRRFERNERAAIDRRRGTRRIREADAGSEQRIEPEREPVRDAIARGGQRDRRFEIRRCD